MREQDRVTGTRGREQVRKRRKGGENVLGRSEETWKRRPTFHYSVIRFSSFVLSRAKRKMYKLEIFRVNSLLQYQFIIIIPRVSNEILLGYSNIYDSTDGVLYNNLVSLIIFCCESIIQRIHYIYVMYICTIIIVRYTSQLYAVNRSNVCRIYLAIRNFANGLNTY